MTPQTHSCLDFSRSLARLSDLGYARCPSCVSEEALSHGPLENLLTSDLDYLGSTEGPSLTWRLALTSVFLRVAGRTLSTCMESKRRKDVDSAEGLSGESVCTRMEAGSGKSSKPSEHTHLSSRFLRKMDRECHSRAPRIPQRRH